MNPQILYDFIAKTNSRLCYIERNCCANTTSTDGTLTSFSSGDLEPIFTTSVATSTSTPVLSFAFIDSESNTLLHGNADGLPYWAKVDLDTEVENNLDVSHLDSGTNADNTTFWRGDGTWATPSTTGITGQPLSRTNDTNVTLSLTGTPLTALLEAVDIAVGWTGVLSVPRGGTGLSSTTPYALLAGGTTSTGVLQQVVSLGTAGQVLKSNGAGTLPTWQNQTTVLAMAPIGSTPNANAGTITGDLLNLQPADVTYGGIVTASDTPQTFKGQKNIQSDTTYIFQGYSGATLRTSLINLGIQSWILNSGSGEVGSLGFSTPVGTPGVVFSNVSGTGRSQIRQYISTGGIAIGASTTGVPVPASQLVILPNANTFITGFTAGDATLVTDTGHLFSVLGTSRFTGTMTVDTTTGVFISPKQTTTQRNALSSVVEGSEIYNTTLHKKQVYDGSGWQDLGYTSVADITALQAISNTETVAHVKDSDRGGTFIYSASANTADNGIVFAATGKGSGYWIRQYEKSLPINVKWFGAKGDGTTDDYTILQAILDYGVAHQSTTNKIYFPSGNYSISAPLIIYKWTGSAYSQTSIALLGESNYAASAVTQITPTYKDTFAIGIQQGKGVTIENISIVGKFTNPTLTTYQFYTTDFASYVDATCRDTQYSPYSGIVIDPFTNSLATLPSDGGYPGLTSYYRGTGTQSGSTGTFISNVSISNFTVGIMSSPNGQTRNAELSRFERITIANCKLGFGASQDQEKTCIINHVKSWGTTHTLFATATYGVGTPGNWIIEGCQIAGNVNTFIYSSGGSYYPHFIKNCFAEGLGTIGYISSSLSSTVEDCVFNLAIPSSTYGNTIMGYKLTGSRAVFRNCTFRFYGYTVSIPFNCTHTFEACSFDKIPYNLNVSGRSADFINCRLFSDGILGATGVVPNDTVYNTNNSVYGNYEIKDRQLARYGVYATTHVSSDVLGITVVTGDAAVTIDVNRSFTIQSTSTFIDDFTVGDLILFSSDAGVNYSPAGYVSAIDIGTYIVTVVYASPLMSSTTYKFALYHPYQYGVEFLGDVTSGSNVITNVVMRNGFSSFTNMVGKFIKHPYAKRTDNNYSPYIKVMSYDSGAGSLTLSRNHTMTTTEAGVFFSNHGTLTYEVYNSGALGVSDMLQKDSFYTANNTKYIVEKSGFIIGADPRQAVIRQVSGRVLYGTNTLDFGSISAAASADLTITVTGAAVNDSVSLGLPAAPTAGIIFFAFVSATDTVTVRATNITGSPIDPASATYKVKVIKY